MASEASPSLTAPTSGQRTPRRTGGRAKGRRRRTPIGPRPRQVTIIGHNSRLVEAACLFVGAEIPVRVFTAAAQIEEALAPYPRVRVTMVEDGYATAPEKLPPPPYILALDDEEDIERVAGWLPLTWARFLVQGMRRNKRQPSGFLHLPGLDLEDRPEILRRLANLAQLDQLCDLARSAKKPLILLYGDPDPDAIGAALGLATLWRKAGTSPDIRYTGTVQRYQNKLLLSYLRRPADRLEDGELEAADLVAVVDAQPGFWRDSPPPAQVVIDHHPENDSTRGRAYVDLRPAYGATSSIITEYLLDAEVAIDRRLATALIYGIATDTDDLKRHTHAADIAAFEALHHRADRTFLSRLEKSQIPPTVLDHIAWGISHRVVYRDLVLIHFGAVPTPDVLVQVADLLLLTYGVTWVVCAGVAGSASKPPRRLVVVFRGDGFQQDVGRKATQAFARLGSAGGHRSMGRAEIPMAEGQTVADTIPLLVDNLFARAPAKRRARLCETLAGHLAGPRPADPDDFELAT